MFTFNRCFARRRMALAMLLAGLSSSVHALTFDEALRLAETHAPQLKASEESLAAARSLQIPAGALPDPRLVLGVDNLPIEGADRYSFFGDGYQASKVIGNRRYWRIPVMEGEFQVQEEFTVGKGIGGGNFLILAASADAALRASEAAVEVMRAVRGVVLPFPGGVVRSGSQVGSKYKFLSASTNTAYCPTIRGRVENSLLPEGVNAVLEIVLDGLTVEVVSQAMQAGIRAATLVPGVRRITAGNYGGRLGKHHFHLLQLLK